MTHNGNSGDDTLPPDLEQALRSSSEDMTFELGGKLNIESGLAAVIQNDRSTSAQGRELADSSSSASDTGGEHRAGRTGLVRFRMLGPLEAWTEGRWATISAAKWRSLLACLLLKPGRIVPTETLIDELWGDNPPSTAANLVSIYVHRLRRVIGDAEGRVLIYRSPGYQLKIADDDTDLGRFESLVADGRAILATGDTESAATLLAEAEGLWRGSFLADVPASQLVSTEAERTRELRLAATELRIGAELTCGRYAQAVSELRSLVAKHPLREGLWVLLMRALDGAGRHVEALDAYGQAREVIAEELGVEPGAELQHLHAELLAVDASTAQSPAAQPARQALAPVASGPEPPAKAAIEREIADETEDTLRDDVLGAIAIGAFADAPGADAPGEPESSSGLHGPPLPQVAQLPADIGDFTGRDLQVQHLRDMLTMKDAAREPGAVRITVVAGAAGLGKTTLAVHAAHQVRGMFPDGQLYADLSGASAEPASPGEVLARFLRDLGVDGDKVPADDNERAAMYRTRLNGRRVLILLDDAKDAAQVRPLLPGTASCAVLVTTRNRTPDLVSTRFVDLNVLSAPEALTLFTRIVGDGRPAAEPDATAEVLLACAGLPLAIRICAARLAAKRQWRVATMARRLRDEQRRLDELQVGDLEVRASFQVSYDTLRAGRRQADPARAFRLLALWQGPTISLPAAAVLLGEPEDDVAEALETLVDANLLESPAPDRYQFHDLLRVFATERVQAEEPGEERELAVARLLRWYLETAEAAADVISPQRYRVPRDASALDVRQGPLASPDDVFTWYNNERLNVIAATRQAASAGLDDIAWRLPTALFPLFDRRANWTDCDDMHRIAVDSARRAGNRHGEALALQNLGQALSRLREIEGVSHLESALAIREGIGDRDGKAQTAVALADAYYRLKGPEDAFQPSLRCLEVVRTAGNHFLLSIVLNNHGELCLELGRLDKASDCFREVLSMPREITEHASGYALHNLGRVQLKSGQAEEAITSLREANVMHRASGDLMGQALALKYLGQAQLEISDEDEARKSWTAALTIFEQINDFEEVAETASLLSSMSAALPLGNCGHQATGDSAVTRSHGTAGSHQ